MDKLELKRPGVLIPSLVALGLVLRLYHYGRNPALWHDEAATVLNVIHKSFGELLGPLYASATGPPLFLWLQKSVTLGLGDGTYALRLVSLLASCLGLIVFARLARQTLAPIGAISAVLLVACSDRLLWHAAEARHYSSDFLIAVLLLALLCLTTAWPAYRRAGLFALLAPVVIFASYPGVFLCGGLWVALWPASRRERRWAGLLLLGSTIAVAFAAFYFFTIRVQRSAAMDAAWLHAFPDWHRPWSVPAWAVRSTVGLVDYFCRPIGGILIVPAIMGAVRFWRAGRRELVLFALVPMFLAMSAAFAKAYPYTGARTMVFAMPALVLLIGHGIAGMVAWRPRHRGLRTLVLAVVVIPLVATFGFVGYRTVVPWPRAETAAASAYVLAHRQMNESVTANHWEYEYYFRDLGEAFSPNLLLLDQPPRSARIWVVLAGHDPRTRDALATATLSRWRVVERHEFTGASVLLAIPQ